MNARTRLRIAAASPFATLLLCLACGGPSDGGPVATASRSAEILLRSEPGEAASARASLEVNGIDWVVGFRAEALDAASGRGADGSLPWRAELRLANGTTLLAAGAGNRSVSFPPGFALPLGQILADTPEAWRGAGVAAAAGPTASAEPGEIRVRATVEYAAGTEEEAKGARWKRLYALTLPLRDEGPAGAAPAARRAREATYEYIVPVDSTVHYAVAQVDGGVASVRLTDLADGKVLWQAERDGAGIGAYSSAGGFPIYREHKYRLDAEFDGDGAGGAPASLTLYLYYRPPGDLTFGYPFPPEGEER